MMAYWKISSPPHTSSEEEPEWELMDLDSTECMDFNIKKLRFLDQKDQKDIEARKESIRSIYKCLTTRDIEFEFHEEKHLFSVKKG